MNWYGSFVGFLLYFVLLIFIVWDGILNIVVLLKKLKGFRVNLDVILVVMGMFFVVGIWRNFKVI